MFTVAYLVLAAAIARVVAECDNQDLQGLWPWQKSWSWLGHDHRNCQRDSVGQQPSLAGSVVVTVGPVLHAEGPPREFEAFPAKAYESAPAFGLKVADGLDLLPRLLGTFQGFFEQTPRVSGFRLQSTGSSFGLLATLPGYLQPPSSSTEAVDDREPALSVYIVGRTLVLRGQHSINQVSIAFQRSFTLPKSADIDRASAVYKSRDGGLNVDLPAAASVEGEEGQGAWTFNPHDGGSHTSLTFSAELVAHASPSLRGGTPSIQEDLIPLVRRTIEFANDLVDPYVGLTADETQPQSRAAWATTGSPALLMQPKLAQPYWRLGAAGDTGRQTIEVVAPWGTDLGGPEGNMVPMFNATINELPRKPIGHVELPVLVSSSQCTWMGPSTSLDRVLRCALSEDDVKLVAIQVAQEL